MRADKRVRLVRHFPGGNPPYGGVVVLDNPGLSADSEALPLRCLDARTRILSGGRLTCLSPAVSTNP
jgi:hypothetical protein